MDQMEISSATKSEPFFSASCSISDRGDNAGRLPHNPIFIPKSSHHFLSPGAPNLLEMTTYAAAKLD